MFISLILNGPTTLLNSRITLDLTRSSAPHQTEQPDSALLFRLQNVYKLE